MVVILYKCFTVWIENNFHVVRSRSIYLFLPVVALLMFVCPIELLLCVMVFCRTFLRPPPTKLDRFHFFALFPVELKWCLSHRKKKKIPATRTIKHTSKSNSRSTHRFCCELFGRTIQILRAEDNKLANNWKRKRKIDFFFENKKRSACWPWSVCTHTHIQNWGKVEYFRFSWTCLL